MSRTRNIAEDGDQKWTDHDRRVG